ncbi:hypothetical protein AS144_02145 [Francisella endosymbiont of Amblyomma maculatum]|nr:hypothetical protein AS144_02145 [Francisella endosymbiont of Amblyomma maculatum]
MNLINFNKKSNINITNKGEKMDKEKYKEMYQQIYKGSNLSLIGMVKFTIELQLYIFIRNSGSEHKKRSFFKGYSKIQKINAAKNLKTK